MGGVELSSPDPITSAWSPMQCEQYEDNSCYDIIWRVHALDVSE